MPRCVGAVEHRLRASPGRTGPSSGSQVDQTDSPTRITVKPASAIRSRSVSSRRARLVLVVVGGAEEHLRPRWNHVLSVPFEQSGLDAAGGQAGLPVALEEQEGHHQRDDREQRAGGHDGEQRLRTRSSRRLSLPQREPDRERKLAPPC